MSFKIRLYTFNKHMNSTLQPPAALTYDEYEVVLKDSCGIMSPVVGLDIGLSSYPGARNYAYIPDFSRYYYVKEWYWSESRWWCYLEEDVLASWRSDIMSQNFYILRSTAAYDDSIEDDMYPCKAAPTFVKTAPTGGAIWTESLSSGYFVISVICQGSNTGTEYYVTNMAGLQALNNFLMADASWLQVPSDILSGGVSPQLLKTLFNPFQYINSITWYPFKPPVVTGSSSNVIKFGWWDTGTLSGSYEKLNTTNAIKTLSFSINLTKHPQAATRGVWLNRAPYTELQLYCGPFGYVNLDPLDFIYAETLVGQVDVDCRTGDAVLSVWGVGPSPGLVVYPSQFHNAVLGVPMQVSQMGVDKLSQAENLIAGAADITRDGLKTAAAQTNISMLLNPIAGEFETMAQGAQTVSTATHAIADGIRLTFPQMWSKGAQGSTLAFEMAIFLEHTFFWLVDEDFQYNGRPYCQTGTLSTGFHIVKDGHIRIAGLEGEAAAIKAYLESGIEIEAQL